MLGLGVVEVEVAHPERSARHPSHPLGRGRGAADIQPLRLAIGRWLLGLTELPSDPARDDKAPQQKATQGGSTPTPPGSDRARR